MKTRALWADFVLRHGVTPDQWREDWRAGKLDHCAAEYLIDTWREARHAQSAAAQSADQWGPN